VCSAYGFTVAYSHPTPEEPACGIGRQVEY